MFWEGSMQTELRFRFVQLLVCALWLLAMFAHSAKAGNLPSSIYTQTSSWTEDTGQTVQLSKWQGQPLIIAMAYTECTRVCNATLHKLEEAQALADQQKTPVQFIIVSFDPSIDNPNSWSYYRRQHHFTERSNWHFLTGTTSATKRLAQSLGIKFWIDEDHVMHDLRILFINPDGQIKTFLDWDHQEVANLFK